MIQGMTSTLEHVLKSSLKISTKIAMSKDEETTPTVNITIFNASQFPMKLLPVEIDFVPVQSDCDSPVHCDSTSSIRIQKNVSTPAPSVFSENSELLPGEKHVELITAKPSCLRQYNGIITASILSPGTGQKLQVQHKFGLYLVDQLKKTISFPNDIVASSDNEQTPESQTCIQKTFGLSFFRRIMGFSPAQGIVPGVRIEITDRQQLSKFKCRLIDLPNEAAEAECKFTDNGRISSTVALETLVSELELLDSLDST